MLPFSETATSLGSAKAWVISKRCLILVIFTARAGLEEETNVIKTIKKILIIIRG
jgi:hypothetical protein